MVNAGFKSWPDSKLYLPEGPGRTGDHPSPPRKSLLPAPCQWCPLSLEVMEPRDLHQCGQWVAGPQRERAFSDGQRARRMGGQKWLRVSPNLGTIELQGYFLASSLLPICELSEPVHGVSGVWKCHLEHDKGGLSAGPETPRSETCEPGVCRSHQGSEGGGLLRLGRNRFPRGPQAQPLRRTEQGSTLLEHRCFSKLGSWDFWRR